MHLDGVSPLDWSRGGFIYKSKSKHSMRPLTPTKYRTATNFILWTTYRSPRTASPPTKATIGSSHVIS